MSYLAHLAHRVQATQVRPALAHPLSGDVGADLSVEVAAEPQAAGPTPPRSPSAPSESTPVPPVMPRTVLPDMPTAPSPAHEAAPPRSLPPTQVGPPPQPRAQAEVAPPSDVRVEHHHHTTRLEVRSELREVHRDVVVSAQESEAPTLVEPSAGPPSPRVTVLTAASVAPAVPLIATPSAPKEIVPPAAPPPVHVQIGRIVVQMSVPAAASPTRTRRRDVTPAIDLDAYLTARDKG